MIHGPLETVSDAIAANYPSFMYISVLPNRIPESCTLSRLLASAVHNLCATGSKGIHTLVDEDHAETLDFLVKLGFTNITDTDDSKKLDGLFIMAKRIAA